MIKSSNVNSSQDSYDVVIPIKNGASFIITALNSVLKQSILPRSIIVVNDSSDDDSFGKVNELIPMALSIGVDIAWIDSDRIGVSAARNTGILRSNSEIIALLDCDDIWLENKMEEQLPFLNSNILVHSGFTLIDTEENFISELIENRPFTPKKLFEMDYQVTGSASAAIFRKSDFLKLSGFDEKLKFSEDFDVWLQFGALGSIFCAPKALVKIRKHPASTQSSLKGNKNKLEHLSSLLYVWGKNANVDRTKSIYSNYHPPLELWIKWFFMEIRFNISIVRKFNKELFNQESSQIVKTLMQFDFCQKDYWRIYRTSLLQVLWDKSGNLIIIRLMRKALFKFKRALRKINLRYRNTTHES